MDDEIKYSILFAVFIIFITITNIICYCLECCCCYKKDRMNYSKIKTHKIIVEETNIDSDDEIYLM